MDDLTAIATRARVLTRRAPVRLAPVAVALALALGGAAAFAAIDTASGRISASTANRSSLLEAARLDVEVTAPQNLVIDADGLYPGLELQRCVTVDYTGSDGVDLRLSGTRHSPAGGLEDFVNTTITRGRGDDPECTDFTPGTPLFDDRLDRLWARHPDFARGVRIGDDVDDGFTTTLRVTVEVVDDDAAQGRTTDFWLAVEARP